MLALLIAEWLARASAQLTAMVQPLLLPLQCASRSHVGRVRTRNEDALFIDAEHRLLVLADGMGGYRGGDVAARIAVDTVSHVFSSYARSGVDGVVAAITRAAEEANREVRHVGVLKPELAGMGATLVVAAFVDDLVVCGHVGDSRLYRYTRGVLELLTRDHTLLQEQIDAGVIRPEEVGRMRYRGMLTRGLGVAPRLEVDVAVHAAGEADIFLLCSDGLTDMVDDEEISRVLGGCGKLDVAAERLVDCANANGGRDNVSVILACRGRVTDAGGSADGGEK